MSSKVFCIPVEVEQGLASEEEEEEEADSQGAVRNKIKVGKKTEMEYISALGGSLIRARAKLLCLRDGRSRVRKVRT